MEMESAKWLVEQDLEEYNFIQEYLKESLSSESYTSYPCSSIETTLTGSQRPNKLQKTSSWSSTITADYHLSPKLTSSCTSHILSFISPFAPPQLTSPQSTYMNLDSTVKPIKNEAVSRPLIDSKPHKRSHSMIRTPSHAQDHILAERKRREKLSQRFIALSALVPGLKKMDKATVLGDAIKYVKQLQERVKALEEQTRKRSVESVVLVKKSHVSDEVDEDSSSCDDSSGLPEIEAKVSEKDVLIRIHCHKQQGLVPKILDQIENLHLSIINTAALPFGNSTLDITIIAQMDAEFSFTVKDLVKNLRLSFNNFM